MIRIRWFGHSMWKISSENVSIIIDPFEDIGYELPNNLQCDFVLSSHNHHDHNNFSLIKGNYTKISSAGIIHTEHINFENIETFHDHHQGKNRGSNLLMKFSMNGHTFLHLGDLGHLLNNDIIKQLGKIDCLFIPIGGIYTIAAEEAIQVIKAINPKIIFPMHYQTDVLKFDLNHLDDFLKLSTNIQQFDSNIIDLDISSFDRQTTIVMGYTNG